MKQQRETSKSGPIRAALAAVAVAMAMAAVPAAAGSKLTDREYAEAVSAFKSGRQSEAFGRFIALANRGDVDAARIALFMHSFGPVLYGTHWEAGQEDMEYWTTLVRNSSAASSRPQPDFVPLAVAPAKKVKQVGMGTKGRTVASIQ
jgi:hypothetical protein